MCDLRHRIFDKTQVKIYKVVFKIDSMYCGCFSGTPVTRGPTRKQYFADRNLLVNNHIPGIFYAKNYGMYNEHMIGKTSGFASLHYAEKLLFIAKEKNFPVTSVILEMTIGGELWEGTTDGISRLDAHGVTYAGTEVIDFKEL